jgi:chromosomal replication initiator protein
VDDHVDPGANRDELLADELWQRCATALQTHLNTATWHTWFEGVRGHRLVDDVLVLSVPSTVARDRISATYAGLIRDVLRDITDEDLEITLDVLVSPRAIGDLTATARRSSNPRTPEPDDDAHPLSAPARAALHRELDAQLNPRYTFEDFVIGASNRFAHAAALSVAEAPARSYNPLFIYGNAGLGKTHLLHGIGHLVRQVYPDKIVCYVSTERFMNEFVESIRTNTGSQFKQRYRNVNVLLIDDIQFIENKEGLQEEFFHTFNSLYDNHSQIVVTSDRAPKNIATLTERLRSRFEWGLTTDIQPPELETRLAILRQKRESKAFDLVPDDVLGFIAAQITDNVRELEGALIRVAAYASLNGSDLTADVAREVLADLLPSDEPRLITPGLILQETADMFGWTVDELIGRSRRRTLVTARQIGMYVFRELTDLSYPQIAKEFGGRDHTTVMHAVDKITNLIAERRAIFDQVQDLINRIKHGDARVLA